DDDVPLTSSSGGDDDADGGVVCGVSDVSLSMCDSFPVVVHHRHLRLVLLALHPHQIQEPNLASSETQRSNNDWMTSSRERDSFRFCRRTVKGGNGRRQEYMN